MSGPLPSSFDGDTDFFEENRWQKFSRRLKEEPLIPLGCALTSWALYSAARSIRAGDSHTANRMFRNRIYAQGFTLVAMVAGSMYYKTDRGRRKEFEGVVAEKKAKEKNEAWIRELEARDREDKEWKAKMDKVAGVQRGKVEKDDEEGSGKKRGHGIVAAVKKELTVVEEELQKDGERIVEAVKKRITKD